VETTRLNNKMSIVFPIRGKAIQHKTAGAHNRTSLMLESFHICSPSKLQVHPHTPVEASQMTGHTQLGHI
jgi:hypothetical protein